MADTNSGLGLGTPESQQSMTVKPKVIQAIVLSAWIIMMTVVAIVIVAPVAFMFWDPNNHRPELWDGAKLGLGFLFGSVMGLIRSVITGQ